MRAACFALVLLSALVAWPAPAAAEDAEALCIIFVRPTADFSTVEITADLILTPDHRDNLSARIDADDDGTITQEEATTYENETSTSYDGATIPSERRIALDGRAATALSVYTRLRNWTGALDDAEKGVVTESRYYRFDAQEQTTHTLTGNLYVRPIPSTPGPTSNVVVEVVIIEAPVGWNVTRLAQADESGRESNVTHPNERQVRLSGFDLAKGVVEFSSGAATAPPPTTPEMHYDPAPGALAVLAIIGLAAWATRSRWRR